MTTQKSPILEGLWYHVEELKNHDTEGRKDDKYGTVRVPKDGTPGIWKEYTSDPEGDRA